MHAYDGTKVPESLDFAARADEVGSDVTRARLALDLIRFSGSDLLYSRATGFYLWNVDDGVWKVDAEDEVRKYVHRIGDALQTASAEVFAKAGTIENEGDHEQAVKRAKYLRGMASRAHRSSLIDSTIRELRAIAENVTPDDFDADPDYLPVANGLLNLETGALTEANRFDLFTQRLETDYREDAECPTWERFLADVLIDENGEPDAELISWVQRLVGYSMTGHTSEQTFTVLTGNGANGKGVFVDTLSALFAEITRTASFETFQVSRGGASGSAPTPDLARLQGSRFVFASEGEEGAKLAEALVKRLTGEDTITARELHRSPFEFRPRFSLFLMTNHLPQVRNNDEGIWRRIKVVPFRRYFKENERDRDLTTKLLAEKEGILAWAAEGARQWFKAGKRLGEPKAVRAETADFRRDSDRLADFLSDRVVFTDSQRDFAALSDLFKSYNEWCDEEKERAFGRNTFSGRLRNRPGVTKDTDRIGKAIFRGLRLKTSAELSADERGRGKSGSARLGVVPGAEADAEKDAEKEVSSS